MKKLRTTLGAGTASLGLIVGLASFAGATSGTIDTTGPDSTNKVTHTTRSTLRVHNNNNLNASNRNHQYADSGKAEVEHNTTGGSARSGNASNANSLNASVAVDNSAGAGGGVAMPSSSNNSGTIRNTGPDSYNKVETKTTSRVNVTNNNNLSVDNSNCQTATTGDAEVKGNTTGGSATTGNATNTNSTTISFKVTN